MNAIGRVFIVLNLLLAAAYIGFTGSYLQRDHNWKVKHDEVVSQAKLEKDSLTSQLSDQKAAVNEVKMTNTGQTTKIAQLENQLKEKDAANVRLNARLVEMETSAKKTEANLATLGSKVEAAFNFAKNSQEMAIAATEARDKAVAAKNDSEAKLGKLQLEFKNQTDDVANKISEIAQANATIKEKDVLLGIANARYPGIFTTLHPLVTGTVSAVSATGSLLTIALQGGAENLKGGHTFAIFSDKDGYKGEAVVTEIDSNQKFCFVRVTLKAGATIAEGDKASTDVSISGN